MAEEATMILLLLCISAFTSTTAGCDNAGPGRCEFNGSGSSSLCGWSLGGKFNLNHTLGGYIELVGASDTGNITSRNVCSTQGQTHCLTFSYKFDVNDIFDLSVSIKSDLSESLQLKVSSANSGWNDARIHITTNQSFNVVFRAKRICGQNASVGAVGIDSIRYKNSSCIMQPLPVSPTSDPAKSSSCNNTMSLPATTSKTTIPNNTVTETTVNAHSNVSSSYSEDRQTSTTNPDKLTPPSGTENEVGSIAGAVVGVIVLIVIVVLIVILCRRKRRNNGKENNTHQNSNLHHQQQATPTQPIDHRAIIVGHTDSTSAPESAMPEYAVVNKQRKVKQEIPPQSPHEMGDQSAQQHSHSLEQNEITEQKMKNRGEDGNYSLARIRDPPTASSSMYQVPRGDTATFSQGQSEEYNVLDFKGDSFAMEDGCVQGESEGAASAVYSHLNGVDEDTYNEVDRQNRPEVIGDEYSHIQ